MTGGLPFTAINTAAGVGLQTGIQVSTKKAIGKILGGSALKALGTLATGSFKKKKAADGMLVGASHAGGGIPIEAEGGEAIINKRSSAMYRPLLSAINESGGGVRFANGGVVGSSNPSGSVGIIDYNALASAMSNLPAPRVAVDEISSVSNRINVIQTQASF